MKKFGLYVVCCLIGFIGFRLADAQNIVHFYVNKPVGQTPALIINGNPATISGGGYVQALTLNTFHPTKIQMGTNSQQVQLKRLSRDYLIPMKIHYTDRTIDLFLKTVPDTLPTYEIEGTIPQNKGKYVMTSFHTLSLNRPSYGVIMDTVGNLLYYQGTYNPKTTLFHPQKFNVSGKTFYTYHIQTEPSLTGAWILGDNVVMNDKFDVIDRVRILPTDRHPAMAADQHDFVILGNNHYLVISYWNEPHQLPDGTQKTLVSAVVQEQKDGQVIFDWVSSDYPITFDMCIEKCPQSSHSIADYVHINTVSVDPKDNNLILSLASPYAVVKLNRQSGDIMWILSGEKDNFKVSPEYRLTRQHDAYMKNGELVVFDNAFSSLKAGEKEQHDSFFKQATARMLRFKLDEKNKKVLGVSATPLNETAPYMGSAQKKGDDFVFFGCGSSTECAAKAVRVDGTPVWTMKVEQPYTTYRAYLMDKPN
ncbi:MAG: aryl-sulfate sulfotransferase [Alphaproteobacteria bacterium]|nr:aryl-sulfate sulfotransferase [Alphaproteobacteria bacterium]